LLSAIDTSQFVLGPLGILSDERVCLNLSVNVPGPASALNPFIIRKAYGRQNTVRMAADTTPLRFLFESIDRDERRGSTPGLALCVGPVISRTPADPRCQAV
jgi:hypothetical protein